MAARSSPRFSPRIALLPLAAALAFALAFVGARAEGAEPGPPAPAPALALPADPTTIDVALRAGVAGRLGSSQLFDVTGRAGFAFGAGVTVAPSPRFAIGLAYERADLGSERAVGELGTIDLTRRTDALWSAIRLTAFRTENFGLKVTIGPGLVWQSVTADLILLDGPSMRPVTLRCSAGSTLGLGLRAAVGAEVHLGNGVWLSADMVFDNLRLSSEVLGECVPGAGTVSLLGGRIAASYRFDVSRWF